MAGDNGKQVSTARETMDTLLEISNLLNTGLDAETLAICVSLCESGVNPEALATVIQELRRESAALKETDSSGGQSKQS
ncbi:mitotic-spindle organizing protein 1 [Lingula anatina]|uniref:Mitotic-spindle organizing protein 1 n=1 Tax=Lingula anatina TaxID=7574 RepID=A0A1S3JKE7_LINAN|nr:mitotic-spindle organizing protein 1 [Lingula anatina]|eukprot:XP_013410601.1 mitotic-spindle organizing protein 1 [Lingula anatina]